MGKQVSADSPSKDRTRAALIELGGAAAKRHGFAALGVDAIAKAAGYTSGAVYKNFKDKSALLKEIVNTELSLATAALAHEESNGGVAFLSAWLDDYLSVHHVKHPEIGALIPALGPEIARASKDIRADYEAQLLALVKALLKSVNSEAQAWVILSTCAGAVMLARGVLDETVSKSILDAARAHLQATVVNNSQSR